MEASCRHPVRLLVSPAFPSPPGGWGAAANQAPRPPQSWASALSKPLPSRPLWEPRPALARCGPQSLAEADPRPGKAEH